MILRDLLIIVYPIPQKKATPMTKILQKKSSTDTEYLSAVERGDMETAQRMVDEAAKRAMPQSKITL